MCVLSCSGSLGYSSLSSDLVEREKLIPGTARGFSLMQEKCSGDVTCPRVGEEPAKTPPFLATFLPPHTYIVQSKAASSAGQPPLSRPSSTRRAGQFLRLRPPI